MKIEIIADLDGKLVYRVFYKSKEKNDFPEKLVLVEQVDKDEIQKTDYFGNAIRTQAYTPIEYIIGTFNS